MIDIPPKKRLPFEKVQPKKPYDMSYPIPLTPEQQEEIKKIIKAHIGGLQLEDAFKDCYNYTRWWKTPFILQ